MVIQQNDNNKEYANWTKNDIRGYGFIVAFIAFLAGVYFHALIIKIADIL